MRDDSKSYGNDLMTIWLPRRREGGRGTEITTLPGGTNLGEIEDIIYFKKKLYKALGVPVSRLEPEGSFSVWVGQQKSVRDEVKFGKFVNRLRYRFCYICLMTCSESSCNSREFYPKQDWDTLLNPLVEYNVFAKTRISAELKHTEIMRERTGRLHRQCKMEILSENTIHKHWLRKNVLAQSRRRNYAMIDNEIADEVEDGEH